MPSKSTELRRITIVSITKKGNQISKNEKAPIEIAQVTPPVQIKKYPHILAPSSAYAYMYVVW